MEGKFPPIHSGPIQRTEIFDLVAIDTLCDTQMATRNTPVWNACFTFNATPQDEGDCVLHSFAAAIFVNNQ
jgi:hypothetical protein